MLIVGIVGIVGYWYLGSVGFWFCWVLVNSASLKHEKFPVLRVRSSVEKFREERIMEASLLSSDPKIESSVFFLV